MKKFIAVLTLLLAFTIGANAQDKKPSVSENAKSDVTKLNELVKLTAEQEKNFTSLFEIKYKFLGNPEATADRKAEMVKTMEAKIKASLTPDQVKRLEANPAVLKNLTGNNLIDVNNPKK